MLLKWNSFYIGKGGAWLEGELSLQSDTLRFLYTVFIVNQKNDASYIRAPVWALHSKGKHLPRLLRRFFHKHCGIWCELSCYLSLSNSSRHLGWQWSVKVHNVILCTVISFPMWSCRVGLVTVHLTSDCKRIRRGVNHLRVVILKIKTGMLYHSSHSVLALLTA